MRAPGYRKVSPRLRIVMDYAKYHTVFQGLHLTWRKDCTRPPSAAFAIPRLLSDHSKTCKLTLVETPDVLNPSTVQGFLYPQPYELSYTLLLCPPAPVYG
jgi:hypothetical protein